MDVLSAERAPATRPVTPPVVEHMSVSPTAAKLEQLHAHFLASDRVERQCIDLNTVPFPTDLQHATAHAEQIALVRSARPQAAFLARYEAADASIMERRAALTGFLQKVAARTAKIARGEEERICNIISAELRHSLDLLPVPERLLWAHVAAHLIDHSSAVRAASYFSQLTGQIRAALRLKIADPHTQLVLAGAALPVLVRHGSPAAAGGLYERCLQLELTAPPQKSNDKLIFHLLDLGTRTSELRPLLAARHAELMSRIEERFFAINQSERTKSMLTLAVMQAIANAGSGEFLIRPRLMTELVRQRMRTLTVPLTNEKSLLTTDEQSLFTLAALGGITSNTLPFTGEESIMLCRHTLAVTAARLQVLAEHRDRILAQRLVTAMAWIGSRSDVAEHVDLHQSWFTLIAENINRLEFPGASGLPVMEYAYRFRGADFSAVTAVARAMRNAVPGGRVALPRIVHETLAELAAGTPAKALAVMRDPYFTPAFGRDDVALELVRATAADGNGRLGADLPEIATTIAQTLAMPYVDGQLRLALLQASQHHIAIPETLNTTCTRENLRLLHDRGIASNDQIAVIGALIRLTGANAGRPLDHAQRTMILAAQWRLHNIPLPPQSRVALGLLLAGSYTATERDWFIDEVLA